MKTNDIQAFPMSNEVNIQQGMTLRDYFAAKAMQGIIASNSSYYDGNSGGCKVPSAVAKDAYAMAEEMLKRKK